MNTPNLHNIPDDFFNKVEIPFKKTKAEVWDDLAETINSTPHKKMGRILHMTVVKYAAAAAILFIISLGFGVRFYTTKHVCENGQRLSVQLPDGSTVDLNSGSELSYQPYWWGFKRNLQLSGEAFFKVQKGKSFIVKSPQGSTRVLGTSFNVFARETNYEVFCQTGKVQVNNKNNVKLIVHPNELAVINQKHPNGYIKPMERKLVLSWQEYKFSFSKKPLLQVIKELERQYNVEIRFNNPVTSNLIYSGYFSKTETVDSALNYVCLSFNLTFEKSNAGVYRIKQNN